MDDGQLSVLNSSPALSSLNEVVEETRQQQEHRPRWVPVLPRSGYAAVSVYLFEQERKSQLNFVWSAWF